MSEKVFYCFDDNDVVEAARLMSEQQVRRLPVLNRDKRMVGIVALADLTRADGDAATHAVRGIQGHGRSAPIAARALLRGGAQASDIGRLG